MKRTRNIPITLEERPHRKSSKTLVVSGRINLGRVGSKKKKKLGLGA
jgi:hypothetical protein